MNDYECMNQTLLECRQFDTVFHAAFMCSPVQMCVHMHICPCVCVGWLGGPIEEEMALWMVCAQRHSKEHSPRRPRALDCTTSNDRIKRGQQEERERGKQRDREWEGNKLTLPVAWSADRRKYRKITFSFSCATSTSVLGVMECVCGEGCQPVWLTLLLRSL